jgi:hypothetical protein
MATIASLLVNLGMNTAKFDSGSKKAVASLKNLAHGAVALNSALDLKSKAKGGLDFLFGVFSTALSVNFLVAN